MSPENKRYKNGILSSNKQRRKKGLRSSQLLEIAALLIIQICEQRSFRQHRPLAFLLTIPGSPALVVQPYSEMVQHFRKLPGTVMGEQVGEDLVHSFLRHHTRWPYRLQYKISSTIDVVFPI